MLEFKCQFEKLINFLNMCLCKLWFIVKFLVAVYMVSQQCCIEIIIVIPSNEIVMVSGNPSTA